MNNLNKKVIVFGAAGFIGSHLIERLISEDYKVYAFDLVPIERSNNLRNVINNPKLKYTAGNITNKKDVEDFFNPDASTVYHLASVVGVRKYIDDPLGVIDTIVSGSRNIIDLCVKHKTRILFASTSEIYGKNPNFPWKEDGDRVLGDHILLARPL